MDALPRRAPALIAVAVGLAALSLLQPWATTYDPWSWIVWGREVAHLDLRTVSGPSWKPLPVVFTTVFSLFGSAAPALWLLTARAAGVLAVVAAYVLGRRLAGPVAGIVAALALVLNVAFTRVVWLGDSEGLLIAAVLFGVERHLAGARRAAFGFAVAAALLRPETWWFVALYGGWLAWRDPAARRLVLGCAGVVAFLWFMPELWGSGQLWRSASRAQQPTLAAATFAPDPALEVLRRADAMLLGPVKVAALLALVAALARIRSRYSRELIALAGAAAVWLVLVAAMTSHGFSGNERYVMAPTAVVCVLGGVGVAYAIRFLIRVHPIVLVAAVVGVCVIALPTASSRARAIGRQAATLEYQSELRVALARAVVDAGGRRRVVACGPVVTEDYSVPMLAWLMNDHIDEVGLDASRRGTVFQARPTAGSPPDPRVRGRLPLAWRAGPVRVYQRCSARS